jgi:hypothetical protein
MEPNVNGVATSPSSKDQCPPSRTMEFSDDDVEEEKEEHSNELVASLK